MRRKAVFITGAARGIGRATAEHFARAGYFVGLYDIDAHGAATTAKEIAATTGEGTTTSSALDVADPAAWQACLEQFWSASGGRLDVLVNNAGILTTGDFAEVPLARHAAIVEINFKGMLNGCHTAFPHLKRTPGSVVVNLCSASAMYGVAGLATYSATKAAVRSLTEALEMEWSRQDIRVCDVQPTFVATDMGAVSMPGTRIKRLSGSLTAEKVAKAVFAAAEHRPRLPHPHRIIGRRTKATAVVNRVAPSWLIREVFNRLSR
ncbi:SDR family oxidoreductase [Saccharopolyspora sp. NPDC049357]|uniref:SDR family oxidoreductase n=1 Tax=Saccharopolyspora sp. NPDC049357 TaxID=3154507 RepID=UPI003434DDEC